MLRIAALFCVALTITACGKQSPTAPSELPGASSTAQPDTPSGSNRTTADEHGEPPGHNPPRP